MNADISSLMSSADGWETVGYIASALVLIGIVIESVELFHLYRQGRLGEKRLEVIGVLIVLVGLAFEIVAQYNSNDQTGRVIATLDEQVKSAESNAAPRSISQNQAAVLVSQLMSYAGTDAAIYAMGDNPEVFGTARIVGSVLNQAAWKSAIWTWNGGGAASGILVCVKEGSDSSTETAARALVNALNAAGLSSSSIVWEGPWDQFGGMLNGPPSPTAASIRVIVGVKPPNRAIRR